jgi:hypothetical protein
MVIPCPEHPYHNVGTERQKSGAVTLRQLPCGPTPPGLLNPKWNRRLALTFSSHKRRSRLGTPRRPSRKDVLSSGRHADSISVRT